MKKILYGVSGIGNGHANRQMSIIEKLSTDNLIYILAYQDSYETFVGQFMDNPRIKIIEIAVPFVVGRKEGLDFGAMGEHEFNQNIDFLKINSKALGVISRELGIPDLVISDYEPICAQYAYSQNVPLVTIDQQSKYLCSDLPKEIGGFTYEDEVQRLHMFFPKTAARIACSFFRTKKKVGGDEVIFMPPPIKEGVVKLLRNPVKNKRILVYISSARAFTQNPTEVIKELSNCDNAIFHLFVNKNEMKEYQKIKSKNVILYPTGDRNFMELMSTCDGIISTAGHSLLSEAMYLGIPVYAVPVAPYEQQMNASVIGDNNFGLNYPRLDREKVKEFVENIDVYVKNIKNDKKVLIKGVGQDLIVDYLRRNFLSKKRILIFSPPFSGHLNVLKEFMADTKNDFYFHLVVTGWKNIRPDLNGLDMGTVTILNDGQLNETDPTLWTFPRTLNLLAECQKITDDFRPDLIIYDFFSIEGNLVGRMKNIPYWCSIPAMIGPFENTKYRDKKMADKINTMALEQLKIRWGLDIKNSEIEMVSDGFHLPGQINLVWSFEEMTPANFKKNREEKPYVFIGNPRGDNFEKNDYKNTKPMIYLSFGTVVMNNLWNNQSEVRKHLSSFIGILAKKWLTKDYQVIFATQGKEILKRYPQNWWVYDEVNQVEVLSRADLFITHGGSNSFHEAIMQKVPMILIPFFGDQLLVAKTAERLGFGEQVGGSTEIDTRGSKDFLNERLVERIDALTKSILKSKKYASKYLAMELNYFDLRKLIKGEIQYKNGDLVIGGKIEIPRSKEELPIKIKDYLDLTKLKSDEYPTEEMSNLSQGLKYCLKGGKDIRKMIDFFATLTRVHCLIDRNEDDLEVKTAIDYYRKNGGNVTFYKKIDDIWVEVQIMREIKNDFQIKTNFKSIILASNNKVKLASVKLALNQNKNLKVVGVELKQKGSEQLIGIDEIIYETMSRIRQVEELNPGNNLISVVSGLVMVEGRWLDQAVVLIKDKTGKIAITKSTTIEFPREIVEKTINRGREKYTASSILGEEYADKKINFDPHRFFTQSRQKRVEVLAETIKRAWEKQEKL